MGLIRTFLTVSFSLALVLVPASSTISNSTRIIQETILDSYNTDIRPCLDCLYPLNITLSFHFSALIKLDELEGELHSVGYLKVVWLDERLTWDPVTTGVGSMILSPDKVNEF